jgi:hypothetical protein
MKSILAFDPGQRNMGVCKFDATTNCTTLSLEDIFKGGTFVYDQLFFKLNAWCDSHNHLLEGVDVVVIEKQHVGGIMHRERRGRGGRPGGGCGSALQSCILQVIQTVLQMWAKAHQKQCMLVSPKDVKQFFGLECTGDHSQNKKQVVQFVQDHHPDILVGLKGKIDDLCDVYLLQKYANEQALT